MEEKARKLVDELKRAGTLDQWRAQIIESFLASGAAADLKRKTREFVASSPDLNPIYLQKPDIAKRQLFSLLMTSTRQKSGLLKDLEISFKELMDQYEENVPAKWREQIQTALEKIDAVPVAVAAEEVEPPTKRAKLNDSGESNPTSDQAAKEMFERILSSQRQNMTQTPPAASSHAAASSTATAPLAAQIKPEPHISTLTKIETASDLSQSQESKKEDPPAAQEETKAEESSAPKGTILRPSDASVAAEKKKKKKKKSKKRKAEAMTTEEPSAAPQTTAPVESTLVTEGQTQQLDAGNGSDEDALVDIGGEETPAENQ